MTICPERTQTLYYEALKWLRISTNNRSAEFRQGQWESIGRILSGGRALVVQRTGWGKSNVSFISS